MGRSRLPSACLLMLVCTSACERPKNVVFKGHTTDIYVVKYSPDGRTIASGSRDLTVRVWDAKTGEARHILTGHSLYILSLSYSPDSLTLASASGDKTIRLWDLKTGKERFVLYGHTDSVNAVSFSPDGRQLASVSNDGTIRFWDPKTGRQTKLIRNLNDDNTRTLAISPDGKILATGGSGRTVILWDMRTGKETASIPAPGMSIMTLAFTPNGGILAVGDMGGTLCLLDVRGRTETRRIQAHTDAPVASMQFSHDGLFLASGGEDGFVRLWDASTLENKSATQDHRAYITSIALSPDDNTLVSGGAGDWENGVHLHNLKEIRQALLIGDISRRNRLKIHVNSRILLAHQTESISVLAFSPDGRNLAAATGEGSICVLDVRTRQQKNLLKPSQGGRIWSLAFLPGGGRLISGGQDKAARVWNVQTGRQETAFSEHAAPVWAVSSSRNGRTVASTSYGENIRLWDASNGHEALSELRGHRGSVWSLALSRDGSTLASAGADSIVRLWDLDERRLRKSLSGHSSVLSALAFASDDRRLASGDWDGAINIWDIESGVSKFTLKGHRDLISSISFAPDGRLLASASLDKTLRLWDTRSGVETAPVAIETGAVTYAVFTPVGNRLAVGYRDGRIWLYELERRETAPKILR